jgi:hypothetical protein
MSIHGAKEFMLPSGETAYVDLADWIKFELDRYRWQLHMSEHAKRPYVRSTRVDGKHVYLHRLLTGCAEGMLVDHINGNGLDNRRANLRICTTAQNTANSRKTARVTSSRFKGVTWHKARRKWSAQIMVDGKHFGLGNFTDEVEAAKAYDAKARATWGEFARTNF